MSRRFNDRPITDSTPLSPDVINGLIVPLDVAIAALEAVRFSWEEQITAFNTQGLKRISDALKPLLTQIQAAISGSLLAAQTDDLVELVEGETITFYVPPAARVAFLPTPFLSIMAPDVADDWAHAQLVSYDNITGLLRAEILYLNGSGAERSGWTISDSAGVVSAMAAWLAEANTAKADADTYAAAALVSKLAAASSAAAALISQNAAAQSLEDAETQLALATAQAVIATAQAGIATTKAAEAAASAASIAGGPVSTVNGRSGPHVTGLAEASDVAASFATRDATIDTKADKSDTYTKAQVDQAVKVARDDAAGFVAQFKYAGFF